MNTVIRFKDKDAIHAVTIKGEMEEWQQDVFHASLRDGKFIPAVIGLSPNYAWVAPLEIEWTKAEANVEKSVTDILAACIAAKRSHWEVPDKAAEETLTKTVDTKICVHASALIELAQVLLGAEKTGDWDEVRSVVECIDDYLTRIPTSELGFNPTITSLILPGVTGGIVVKEDESEVCCAGGIATSDFSDTFMTKHPKCRKCPYRKICTDTAILLESGTMVDYAAFSRNDGEIAESLNLGK